MMTRAGMSRPLVFPMKRDLKEDIVFNVLRTMGCSRKDLESYLNPPKGSSSAIAGSSGEES